MNMLTETACQILSRLHDFCSELGQEKFTREIPELSGSTIGQHTRHIVEFFGCLLEGYETGIVNYDRRKHDKNLEQDLILCLSRMEEIKQRLPLLKEKRLLELHCSYSLSENDPFVCIQTVAERELAYNIEHAVHHMAIIKIGASVVAPEVKIASDFGTAVSTLKYRKSHVHSNLSAR